MPGAGRQVEKDDLTLTHLSLAQTASTGGGNQNTGEEEKRPMNAPIDLKTARHRLEIERAMLQARIAEVSQTLDLPDERLTDILDVAEAASDRQLQTTLLAHSQQHLQEVETALRRLEAGTYGLCERCGGAIQPERLSVLPYTTTCFNCQTRQEQVSV
jgi:DnaK suppressor protein